MKGGSNKMEMPQMLTVKETAKILRISPAWIYSHIRRQILLFKYISIGKRYLFHETEIIGFLKRRGIEM